jgi:hypothetical protein
LDGEAVTGEYGWRIDRLCCGKIQVRREAHAAADGGTEAALVREELRRSPCLGAQGRQTQEDGYTS